MSRARLQHGQSDPVSYTCTCGAGCEGGLVLLFYRYYANTPRLQSPSVSTSGLQHSGKVQEVADWHQTVADTLVLSGKIRVASEGFNVTVAGSTPHIESYIDACCSHWSFQGLPLGSQEERQAFFKPSPGCACVFAPATRTAVRVCAEITPLGITDYAPTSWSCVTELEPAEFHRRCQTSDVELMDLRNHYESRIGYFVNGLSLEPAVRPPIRRFSQWPRWALAQIGGEGDGSDLKQLLTYCTGGIRCEKASRWLAEQQQQQQQQSQAQRQISTLRGGIAAYLAWVDSQVAAGAMSPDDSLFKGRNYVFDARGTLGLSRQDTSDDTRGAVAQCHACGCATSRLAKCSNGACHLVLVVCAQCSSARCCGDCGDGAVRMCSCERAREDRLWGSTRDDRDPQLGRPRAKGWLKAAAAAAAAEPTSKRQPRQTQLQETTVATAPPSLDPQAAAAAAAAASLSATTSVTT